MLKSDSFDIAHYHCACGQFGVIQIMQFQELKTKILD